MNMETRVFDCVTGLGAKGSASRCRTPIGGSPCGTATLMVAALLVLSACGDLAKLPVLAVTGPQPTRPPPSTTWIPTLNIAPAKGWPPGATPLAAPGTRVTAFASGLDHPRWLYVLPNGDVLVGDGLFVANTDAVLRFPYTAGIGPRTSLRPRTAKRFT